MVGAHVGWLLLAALAFCIGRWSSCHAPKPLLLSAVTSEVDAELYPPPKRHGKVSVPSVIRDARGEVHNLRFGGQRVNILVSAAGTVRSGDVHRAKQLDMMFSGHARVTTREWGRDVKREYVGGQLIVIPENVPHIFHFLNKTVMAEWWEGGHFEARYYRPYRQIVDDNLRQRLLHSPVHRTY